MNFNTQQLAAINYLKSGGLLVLAGAGSGKTRVITQKIINLINDNIFAAKNIAAVTFTNKAANEMRERIANEIGKQQSRKIMISTFHSLGLKILRENAHFLNYKKSFSLFNSNDSYDLINKLCAESNSKTAQNLFKTEIKDLQNLISNWKNDFLSPDDVSNKNSNKNSEVKDWQIKIYKNYQKTLKAYQAVDFDDLIFLPVLLFKKFPQVLNIWQQKIKYLLIDEYQDTNLCQYELFKLLVSKKDNQINFTVVGDDDQSIYAWRGANVQNILQLTKDFANLKIIKLEQNYRSTKRILDAANTLIQYNKQEDSEEKLFLKKLWSNLGDGEEISFVECKNFKEEVMKITNLIVFETMISNKQNFGDFAILYRSNYLAEAFQVSFEKNNIPYTMSANQTMFDKNEIKDLLSYCRLLLNTDDDAAFIRAIMNPKRNITAGTIQILNDLAMSKEINNNANIKNINNKNNTYFLKDYSNLENHLSLFETIKLIANYANSPLNFNNTKNSNYHKKLEQALAKITLSAKQDLLDFYQLIIKYAQRAEKSITNDKVCDILNDLLDEIDYQDYLFNTYENPKQVEKIWQDLIQKFISNLQQKSIKENLNLNELTQKISLVEMLQNTNNNDEDFAENKVRLLTFHAAKGLEFNVVFMISLEQGILPHEDCDIQEERRLCYVGITRAKQKLYLSYPKQRIINGELKNNSASQFLREIKAKISDKKTDFRDYSNKENIKDNFDFLRLALNKKTA